MIRRVIKIIGRIIGVLFVLVCAVFSTMLYKGCEQSNDIKEINSPSNISIFHNERDEQYLMEQVGFKGIVTYLSPGHHRGSIDTVTIKLSSWISSDSLFKGDTYLKKSGPNSLSIFISYADALYPPKYIEEGDSVSKEQFSYDFSIYDKQHQFKKNLSLLFCSYESPDTIIQNGNFIYGTYGSYFNSWDTLFSGTISKGKRNGSWRYYQAHTSRYKLIEGPYTENKRNGVFKKYYRSMQQLLYEEHYKDNLPNGQFTWWFSNGKIESKKYFLMGQPIGDWEFYNENGKLINKVNYRNDH